MNKYELDKNDSIEIDNHTLYRVIYTDEFVEEYNKRHLYTIDKKGGYIESKDNLSQKGFAVVLNNARLFENATMSGNAQILGDAQVCGYAQIFGDAQVGGYAEVSHHAMVYGNAEVYGDADVFGNELVSWDIK